ncbi:hypothetical protein [Burkholderia sp. WTPI3]|uniref:hypothetical protein n=1 Tax=Burkholderia sp. WTPI3 TaxID=2822167 RepID=UPI001F1CCBC3|nr:hypothetical protein [Burkholderia sp. WTPI3]
MTIHHDDPLRAIFGKNPSRREVFWLWQTLRDEREVPPPELINGKHAQAWMAQCVLNSGLQPELDERRKLAMPDERELAWIGNDQRQINWLSHQINDYYGPLSLDLPAQTDPRDSFFLHIDFWNESIDHKIKYISKLKNDWVQLQTEDKYFSWFKKDRKEKLRCSVAWDWYQTEHPGILYDAPRFKNIDEIFLFLDISKFRLDEKRYHLEQIKKELKRRESLDRLKDKAQTNFALSKDVRRQLDNLVEEQRQTMVAVIERLIRHASEHGMPDESIRERFTDSNKR